MIVSFNMLINKMAFLGATKVVKAMIDIDFEVFSFMKFLLVCLTNLYIVNFSIKQQHFLIYKTCFDILMSSSVANELLTVAHLNFKLR